VAVSILLLLPTLDLSQSCLLLNNLIIGTFEIFIESFFAVVFLLLLKIFQFLNIIQEFMVLIQLLTLSQILDIKFLSHLPQVFLHQLLTC
jgi:hypothetical protein